MIFRQNIALHIITCRLYLGSLNLYLIDFINEWQEHSERHCAIHCTVQHSATKYRIFPPVLTNTHANAYKPRATGYTTSNIRAHNNEIYSIYYGAFTLSF